MYEGMYGWMDGCMDVYIYIFTYIFMYFMYVCMVGPQARKSGAAAWHDEDGVCFRTCRLGTGSRYLVEEQKIPAVMKTVGFRSTD